VGAGLSFGEWQSVELKLVANPDQTPRTATIGFDKVSEVFARQAYGPCSDCHSHEWPYLSTADWPRFLESLSGENHGITTKEDLATLIVGCVDQSSSDHCAGDRDDSSDNLDFKMPTKFGMDPVSADDLTLLQRWLEDGVLELGQNSRRGFTTADIASLILREVSPQTVEVKLIPKSLIPGGNIIVLALMARISGPCVDAKIKLYVLNSGQTLLGTILATLQCDGAGFIPINMVHIDQ
jgi:hypothetical protein